MAGTVYTLLAALGFAAVSTFTEIALNHGASLWNVLMWRFAIGAAVMALVVIAQRNYRMAPAHALQWLVLGGGGQALLVGMALSSLKYLTVATLAFLFYTYPAWVVIVQAVRGVEPVTRRRLIALVLSFTGTALVAGAPTARGLPWQGVALGLGAAVVYALYIPLMMWMQRTYPVSLTTAYAKAGSALCFLIVGAIAGSLTMQMTQTAWMAVVALATVSTVLPTIFFMKGLMRLGPGRTAIVSTVEPFITAQIGALVLAQPIAPNTLFGGFLIVVAVVILQDKP
ncbi:MAG: DMT family transporter [Acidobacteriota bacterium]